MYPCCFDSASWLLTMQDSEESITGGVRGLQAPSPACRQVSRCASRKADGLLQQGSWPKLGGSQGPLTLRQDNPLWRRMHGRGPQSYGRDRDTLVS